MTEIVMSENNLGSMNFVRQKLVKQYTHGKTF